MSTTIRGKPMPSEVPSRDSMISNSARTVGGSSTGNENTHNDDEANINDVESLKQGIIKTSQHKAEEPYTILLVGGPGVGKPSVVQFIANVFQGKDIDHYDLDILDHTNEQGDSGDQSRIKGALLYKFKSRNGIVVHILDTPGFAETGNVQQDEFHKKEIANQIRELIDSVTAVLVLANGTVPRITVGMKYALSTLSDIFPSTLANNVGFMFTNISSPLSRNFCQDTVPDEVRGARRFEIDNPFSLQKRYLKLKDDQEVNIEETRMREEVNTSEKNALEVLVDLFDWLDGLEPQQIKEKQARGIPAQITGFLRKAKRIVQKAVRKVRGDIFG